MAGRPKIHKVGLHNLGEIPEKFITHWVDDELWIKAEVERINSKPGHKVIAVQHPTLEGVWGIERL